MFTKKFSRRFLAASLAVGAFTFAPNFDAINFIPAAQAEVKMYSGVGEDYPSPIENLEVSRLRAVDKAVKSAVEKAGVALTAYSRMQNFNLAENEITAITSNTYQIVGEPKCKKIPLQVSDLSSMIIWQATANVNVDDSDIKNWLNKKFEEGVQFYFQGNFNEAVTKFSEAIVLNPNFFRAYHNRGEVYMDLKNYRRAIDDYNKIFQLSPELPYFLPIKIRPKFNFDFKAAVDRF